MPHERIPLGAAAEGSGFLCLENDDATAYVSLGYSERAGIRPESDKLLPGNAYPWYINRRPNANEFKCRH